MQIKRNYLFFPDKEGTEAIGYKSDAKLRLRVRFDKSKIVNFNVGYRVDLKKWSTETQRCKSGTTHSKKKISASEINTEIQRLENLADNVFKCFEVMEYLPDEKEYRAAFNEANGKSTGKEPERAQTFFTIFDEFTRTMGWQNSWTSATFTKFSSIRKHLFSFDPKLDLKTLNEEQMQLFVAHLHKEDMRNTTIAKNVAFVKWFLRWANAKGYYPGNLHMVWKPKFKGTDGNQKEVIHLTWNELMSLYNFDFSQARMKVKDINGRPILTVSGNPKEIDLTDESKKMLGYVRDVFCFCCFTSLRYSDVAKLSRSDVRDTFISIVTQKTTDGLKIELNKYSKAILDKYKDVHFPKNKVLPVISNQKMNDRLKEMGEIAGINEDQRIVYFKGNERIEEVHPKYNLLTTHCGRRTFIVNALFLGIPAEVVMRWTGHSDYKAMKPYIKIVDLLKEQEMNKFNQV
ncbi:integrase domain protein SAM domain protein [Paludibacter propionicigenes WB4]|uniref:Integrase domain protein SAM domain protein n=1 Tax=Paludibacter propionicigenes (strain DSM 17365 / JCM 13257 / WB4) TaxID=694427 RepID=E4T4T6_PALPW|nr:site-specific integrase [Paludibacter propionicigenes]ADQ79730.1 integrase domain protein SAM domain protein [Paludibacter propionicigenes WB4]